jgi:hypothetical protein
MKKSIEKMRPPQTGTGRTRGRITKKMSPSKILTKEVVAHQKTRPGTAPTQKDETATHTSTLYASQSAATLTFHLLEVGCGIVGVHNAFALLGSPIHMSVVSGAFMMLKNGDVRNGLSPMELFHLVTMLLKHAPCGIQCTPVEPASVNMLTPGALLHVSSVKLAHLCLPAIFDVPMDAHRPDSHIVMVERVNDVTITIINPDVGVDGTDQEWGRFVLSHQELYQAWSSTRHDSSITCRAALILALGDA